MAEKKKTTAEKPLDKMTVKELREIALEIPSITGVHGMNKEDLLSAIKAERGITEEGRKKSARSMRETKQKIKALKVQKTDALKAADRKMADVYRRRISRLKKKTRRV